MLVPLIDLYLLIYLFLDAHILNNALILLSLFRLPGHFPNMIKIIKESNNTQEICEKNYLIVECMLI